MLKFNYNNENFAIDFSYINSDNARIITLCEIFRETVDHKYLLVGKGWSIKHPQDQHYKDVGRKIALKRALENFIDNNVKFPDKKGLKTKVWTEYFLYTNNKKVLTAMARKEQEQ